MIFKKFLNYIPFLAIALIAFSAGLILYFILRYGVDVPYMDQWEYVRFFDHLAKGTLNFDELFALQCEYRQLFPNLIFVALGWLTHWNVKYEMIVIFLLACLTSYNIFRLASYTFTENLWLKWVLLFLANVFIFSPLQYENWLFGVQIQYLMPIACVTSCMVIAFSGMGGFWKLIFCMGLAIISTYSAVNGLLCWFLILPVLYYSGNRMAFFKEWPYLTAWGFGAVFAITFYFIDYQEPENFPSPFEVFFQPYEALKYFFAILGNPIRIVHSLSHIIAVGGVLFSVFMTLVFYVIWHYKDKKLFRNSAVWVMMGFYSILTAGMVMVGRLGFGVFQSLTSRYTSYTLYLVVATIFLSGIVIQHLSKKIRFTYLHKIVIALIIVYIVYIKIDTYPVAVSDLKSFHANVLHGKAGLMFINFFPHDGCEVKIYPINFNELQKRANILDSMGYLKPGLIKSNVLQAIEDKKSDTIDYGSFDGLNLLSDTAYTASGFSCKPGTKIPADAVLLSYDDDNGNSVFFSLFNADALSWGKTFPITLLPQGHLLIRAWAFDANTGKAFRLKGMHEVEV